MKKILFATTALIATASVAAADVSFSGYGRFGARHLGAGTGTTGVYTRIRLQVDMSTEADNGLVFGARLRHEVDSWNGSTNTMFSVGPDGVAGTADDTTTFRSHGFNTARFYAKAGGFQLGVGNIFGAIDFMPGNYANTQSSSIGLSGLGFNDLVTGNSVSAAIGSGGWDAYSSKGAGATPNQGVEAMYSAGDFGGHLSYSKNAAGTQERLAAHVSYSFNDWTVALGYQDSNVVGEDILALTVSGKIGNFGVDLGYSSVDGPNDDRIVVRGYADIGAATKLTAYISSDGSTADGQTEDMAFGLGVSHSLGGGASIEAGVGRDFMGDTNADLGIRFNF